MKTEGEVRAHLADLEWALTVPCNCPPGPQSFECNCGREMMVAVISTLKWALGERNQHQEIVDRLHHNHLAEVKNMCDNPQPQRRRRR